MKIADFLISIGLNGTDKVKKGLKEAQVGLQDVGSSALAAKAAIVGALYGLERMTGFASRLGMDFTKFNAATGLSVQRLQELEYAANKYDVSGQEVEETIRGIQREVANIRMGKSNGEGFGLIGIDQRKMDDTFYVYQKMIDFAKSHKPAEASSILSPYMSANMFQMARLVKKSDFKIPKGLAFTDKEVANLTEIHKEWRELWYELQQVGSKFIASKGFMEFFKGVQDDIHLVVDITKKLNELTNGLSTFTAATVIAGAAMYKAFGPLGLLLEEVVIIFHELKNLADGKAMFGGMVSADNVKKFKDVVSMPVDMLFNAQDKENANKPFTLSPTPAMTAPSGAGAPNQVNNDWNVYIQGNVDRPSLNELKKITETEKAARQMNAVRSNK